MGGITREELYALAESREFKTWRGRSIKRMCPLPWTSRNVVFTCSNGWTIEAIERDDHWIEGVMMGHCLGLKNGDRYPARFLSLRDEHGVPHATLDDGQIVGRCNGAPPEKYVELIREYIPHAEPSGRRTYTDKDYYEKGVLNDKDYRDFQPYACYRNADWEKKRAQV